MLIYVLLLLTCTVFETLFSNPISGGYELKKKKRLSRIVLLLLFVAMFLIQALRDTSVGGDIEDSYKSLYEYFGTNTISESRANWNTEIGYILLNKIVYICSNGNVSCLLGTISFVYLLSVYWFIVKYSKNPFFSLFIFVAIGLFNSSMNTLRSTIGMSFLLFSIGFMFEKKPVRSIFFLAIAFLFHRTMLVILLLYLVLLIKNRKAQIAIYCVIFASFLFFFSLFQGIISSIFPKYNQYFESDSSGHGYGLLIALVLCVIFFIAFTKKDFWKKDYNYKFLLMIICATCLQTISLKISFFARATSYLSISIVILLPSVIKENWIKNSGYFMMLLSNAVLWGFYIFLLASNSHETVPYSFAIF